MPYPNIMVTKGYAMCSNLCFRGTMKKMKWKMNWNKQFDKWILAPSVMGTTYLVSFRIAARWCIDCDGTLPKSGKCPYCRQPYPKEVREINGDLHKNAQFIISRYDDCMGLYWFRDGRSHREGDHPAWIRYSVSGTIKIQCWYRDGRIYREGDHPAWIQYSECGTITAQCWCRDGQQYRSIGKIDQCPFCGEYKSCKKKANA